MTITRQSALVNQLVPEFVRADLPTFVAFLEAYYEYVDGNTNQRKLLSSKDLDETMDMFIESFKRDFAVNIPTMANLSSREFLRNAKAFYTAKGTEDAFKFLFRAMYGKEISVYYPEVDILRASDGRWSQEKSSVATLISGNPFDMVGQRIKISGSSSSFVVLVDRVKYLNDNHYEVFFDTNSKLAINPGFILSYNDVVLMCEPVIDTVLVTKKGAGFRVGQILNIDGTGTGARIRVTRVDIDGGILYAKPISFGFGYTSATYFGSIISKASTATANTFNTPSDKILGTSDAIVISSHAVSAEYSVGYEGVVRSSQYTVSNVPNTTDVFEEVNQALIEVRFGGVARYPGYYATSNGFLSDSPRLQDNWYYQIYSYVLRLDEQLDTYKTLVKALLHPAGTQLFGEYELTTEVDLAATVDLLDKSIKLTPIDIVYAGDHLTFSSIKVMMEYVDAVDQIYIRHFKNLTDSVSVTDAGIITRVVPGDYSDGTYFSQSYTQGAATVIGTF